MTKSELRKLYLEKRNSLSPDETVEKSQRIAERFFDSFDLRTIKTLHCFIPIAKFIEIETGPIYKKIWADFPSVHTIIPRVERETGDLENLLFTVATQLVENDWGIREPLNGESIKPVEIDMILVPLLCFDVLGHRVGYGRGFYDKFLSKCRADCVKVGLSYFSPLTEITDADAHDIRLDHCVTPNDVFSFSEH